MVDFIAAVATAGLALTQQILYKWITSGKVRIKSKEIDADILRAAKEEAERSRLRIDELENYTRQLIEQLIALTPQLYYRRTHLLSSSSLYIDYDPHDSRSAKELLDQLNERLSSMSKEFSHMSTSSTSESDGRDVKQFPVEGLDENFVPKLTSASGPLESDRAAASLAIRMLEDLQERVNRRENPRS